MKPGRGSSALEEWARQNENGYALGYVEFGEGGHIWHLPVSNKLVHLIGYSLHCQLSGERLFTFYLLKFSLLRLFLIIILQIGAQTAPKAVGIDKSFHCCAYNTACIWVAISHWQLSRNTFAKMTRLINYKTCLRPQMAVLTDRVNYYALTFDKFKACVNWRGRLRVLPLANCCPFFFDCCYARRGRQMSSLALPRTHYEEQSDCGSHNQCTVFYAPLSLSLVFALPVRFFFASIEKSHPQQWQFTLQNTEEWCTCQVELCFISNEINKRTCRLDKWKATHAFNSLPQATVKY